MRNRSSCPCGRGWLAGSLCSGLAGRGGQAGEDGCTHVLKKELVSVLQVLFQTQRQKSAVGLPHAETFSPEIVSFQANVRLAGGSEDVSWREREQDDLVLAVALAAWEGECNPPSVGMPLIVGERWGRCGHMAGRRAGSRGHPHPKWSGRTRLLELMAQMYTKAYARIGHDK